MLVSIVQMTRLVQFTVLTLLAGLSCGEVKAIEDAADIDVLDATVVDAAVVDATGLDADLSCNSNEVCLSDTPSGWNGPVAVGNGACPSTFPNSDDVVNSGLIAPEASCSCGCVVNGVSCQLHADNNQFIPQGSCDVPTNDNATLTAEILAGCTSNTSSNIIPASWTETQSVCGDGIAGQTCDGGTCFANADSFGALCIVRDGDHACPTNSDYSVRSLFHRTFDDTRNCTSCDCAATGQACEIDLEICSLSFFDVTLNSNNSSSYQLNESEGEGVSLQASRITANGTCSSSGGAATGEATPISAVTACCLP